MMRIAIPSPTTVVLYCFLVLLIGSGSYGHGRPATTTVVHAYSTTKSLHSRHTRGSATAAAKATKPAVTTTSTDPVDMEMDIGAAAAATTTTTNRRRALVGRAVASAAAALLTVIGSESQTANAAAVASDDAPTTTTKLIDLYMGVGCFWHIQHEFVDAERQLLKRGDHELTARTGYAGGTKTGSEGRVCYHNFQALADYGKLGHAEVVGMKLPEDSIGEFAKVYFSLFSPKGERVDPGDKGSEYRSLIGLPGGVNHAMYPQVEEAAKQKGFTLEAGKGNDPDTFGKRLVYVYDSNKFPFHQAEIYHQYHNDFQSPAYGKEYNNLANVALEDGRIQPTGCPDRV